MSFLRDEKCTVRCAYCKKRGEKWQMEYSHTCPGVQQEKFRALQEKFRALEDKLITVILQLDGLKTRVQILEKPNG